MHDALFGTRDKRGDWRPNKPITYPPVFVWPTQPLNFLKWMFGYPGYIMPWNLLYGAIGVLLWLYATPSLEVTKTFSVGWVSYLFIRNAAMVLLVFGAFHFRLYMQRKQQTSFKFNGKWPSKDNSAFLLGNQTADNMIWTFASAVPIWTGYEALTLWAFSHHYIPYVGFAGHPIYCAAVFLLVPLWREVHFYLVHRLIHAHALYHTVHKLHHNNVNPGPWSGLAMHPVEHLLYFSGVLIHWVVPSHPVHAIFNLVHAGLAPAPGHTGFDRIILSEDIAVETHSYDHYLHHKFFECNYADGAIPIDKWFGTFHDGSKEAEIRMNQRFKDRAAKQAAKREAKTATREA